MPQFGLNRLDYRSPRHFAADARRAEELGWDWAFIPDSQLNLPDPYVMLATAAHSTDRIGLGVLVTNPVIRDVTATAASAATLESIAPGRTLVGFGVGDTAVRLAGKQPSRVAELERAVADTRALLRGDQLDMGAVQPAQLRTARLQPNGPAPIWVAAGGPRTLRAAGRVADGVFIRVGPHPGNIRRAVDAVHAGAVDAGRRPSEVHLGLVLHTILMENGARAIQLGKSMAAGYYEYAPYLFDAPGLRWDGPPVEELREHVWPDFHHAPDLDAAAQHVDFLPQEAADAFSLHGNAAAIAHQLQAVLNLDIDFDIVVPQPVPPPPTPQAATDADPTYMQQLISDVRPRLRSS